MIRMAGVLLAGILAASPVITVGAAPGADAASEVGAGTTETVTVSEMTDMDVAGTDRAASYDVEKFVLPEDAGVLVVVEGTGGVDCTVRAFEQVDGSWVKRVEAAGHLGKNGLSNDRTEGDSTTPIGLFQMNTPFGQAAASDGFPANYIQVDSSYVWEDDTNRLVQGSTAEGERVGSAGYAGYYDYVLDFGYNPQAISGKGSALFLHCEGADTSGTHGCVAIPTESMREVMKLYGTYGDGRCYIALAPEGTFDRIYSSYGANDGLSPEGDFTSSR
ncbi:MAG: L,D-transpeptidase family protein [Clostridiales bacterium]|nr:L,D-transpeptidase family protein [Clostridiales bacterium]